MCMAVGSFIADLTILMKVSYFIMYFLFFYLLVLYILDEI